MVRRQLRLLDETLSKRRVAVKKALVYKPNQHDVIVLPKAPETDVKKVDEVIRAVDPNAIIMYVPGCPPKPEAMISAAVKAMEYLKQL